MVPISSLMRKRRDENKKKSSISKDKPNVFWCFLVECLDIASFDVPLSVIADFTHSVITKVRMG
jgi:hypothetical protein